MRSPRGGGLLSYPTRGGQIPLAQKFRVEQLGLITLSAIREDGHDGLARCAFDSMDALAMRAGFQVKPPLIA